MSADFISGKEKSDDTWISAADMMAGLMMIFLFIAIIYIRNIGQYFDEINDVQSELCSSLNAEFRAESEQWNMTICESGLLIRFESETYFERSRSSLTPEFRRILSIFVPRLFDVLWEYEDQLSEVRIEGHTSSRVRPGDTAISGYLYNTELSQDRSRNVMAFALASLRNKSKQDQLAWSYRNLTAHGMSSSDPILKDGQEDFARSRRVEFRIRTTAQDKLNELIQDLDYDA